MFDGEKIKFEWEKFEPLESSNAGVAKKLRWKTREKCFHGHWFEFGRYDGVKCLVKHTREAWRQMIADELKPVFGLVKMGSMMSVDPGEPGWQVVMHKFHPGCTSWSEMEKRGCSDTVVEDAIRIAILDMVIANRNRQSNAILTKEERLMPIDELTAFAETYKIFPRLAFDDDGYELADNPYWEEWVESASTWLSTDIIRKTVYRYIVPGQHVINAIEDARSKLPENFIKWRELTIKEK